MGAAVLSPAVFGADFGLPFACGAGALAVALGANCGHPLSEGALGLVAVLPL